MIALDLDFVSCDSFFFNKFVRELILSIAEMLNYSITSVAADTFIRSSIISFNNASQMSGFKDTLFGFEEVGGGISLGRINCSTIIKSSSLRVLVNLGSDLH